MYKIKDIVDNKVAVRVNNIQEARYLSRFHPISQLKYLENKERGLNDALCGDYPYVFYLRTNKGTPCSGFDTLSTAASDCLIISINDIENLEEDKIKISIKLPKQ